MATETLNPNADGTTNEYTRSAGSADKYTYVNDGDDNTYLQNTNNGLDSAHWWAIRIDGTTIYDADTEPGISGDMEDETDPTNFTREINSTNFSGCPEELTTALITSLEIGMKSGVTSGTAIQLFNLDNPTFPDSATINSAIIHGRLSYNDDDDNSFIFEMSLVVDYTAPPTFLKIKSSGLTIKGGKLTIK